MATMELVYFSVFFLLIHSTYGSLFGIKPRVNTHIQADEVLNLLKRSIPNHFTLFDVNINQTDGKEKEVVHIHTYQKDGKVHVSVDAENGVSAAFGINQYLKYHCRAHFSWNVIQTDSMPDLLPETNMTLEIQDRFKYHQNVCVYSYTMAFWTWNDWEKHIDWMALNGINIPLAFTGQEEIWRRTFSQFELTDEDLQEFFAGPAFLAWGRMGNLNNWGGPLWPGWHKTSVELQHKILGRMRNLGMMPILPGFNGYVPKAFVDKHKVNYTELYWYGFGPTYLLDFEEQFFEEIGSKFIGEYEAEFGPSDHLYSCDTFNEMTPPTNDPEYIDRSGKAIYKAMATGDPDAVWVMQGWIFYFQSDYWKLPQAEALLTSVPKGKMLILDLYSTHEEQYSRTNSYFGQPFIYNDLSNFGGNPGLFGHIEEVNNGPSRARQAVNSTMVGTGFTMEGLDLTYLTVDLMSEMSWRSQPYLNITEWVDEYTCRRYGKCVPELEQAWNLIARTALNSSIKEPRYLINELPDLSMSDLVDFDQSIMPQVFNLFLAAVENNTFLENQRTFRYDLIDITRQVSSFYFSNLYNEIISLYHMNDSHTVETLAGLAGTLLDDLNQVLLTDELFLLGHWIESAKTMGETHDEQALLEYNAKIQITLWGPKGEHLDYAAKHWNGLVSDYYAKRWKLFFDYLLELMSTGDSFDKAEFRERFIEEVANPFLSGNVTYATVPEGDLVSLARNFHKKSEVWFLGVDKLAQEPFTDDLKYSFK